MSDEIKSLISGNDLYNDNYDRWEFLYNSYVGGRAYREAGYLIRYQLEDEAEYQSRLMTTPLQNECSSTISTYVSFLFREEPVREFNSIQNVQELEGFLKDSDLEGRSFNNFLKEATIWAQVLGHSWIIMSKPNVSALTRADELSVNVRPYLSLLTPLTMLDWNWERKINGAYELTYIKYIEEINGDIQVIKEWTKEEIKTTIVDTEKELFLDELVDNNELGVIPAVILYNNRSIVRGIGVSAINDIADMQKLIYNCTSEAMESIKLDSHPSLVKTADTIAGVGAGAIIQMPENMPGDLKPYVLDFAGASIDNIYKTINNTVQAIEKMASIGSVRATESKTLSGVALETEFALLNSVLSEKAANLELAEEQIWRLFCRYQGYTYDMTIDYPNSFNLRDIDREISQLKAMKEVTTQPELLLEIDNRIAVLLEVEDFMPVSSSINDVPNKLA